MSRLRPECHGGRVHGARRALPASLAALALALSGGCHLISGLDDLVIVEPSDGGSDPGGAGGSGTGGGGGMNLPPSSSSSSSSSASSAGGTVTCGGDECIEKACCGGACVDLSAAPHCGDCGNDCFGGRACEETITGARICGPTWIRITATDALPKRKGASAVWLGDSLFFWGGRGTGSQELKTGARFDPLGDLWTPITSTGAPSKRAFAGAVWTGSRVIVWGGGHFSNQNSESDGGLYDPSSDSWLAMSNSQAPPARKSPIAVWTGTEMIVWGGEDGGALIAGGARYNAADDAWAPISQAGAPSARSGAAWTWSGTELLLFGGRLGGSNATSQGYAYDPATDTWRALSMAGAPSPRYDAFGVWMDGSFLVVGGRAAGGAVLASGAKYDPTSDAWTPIADAPQPRASVAGRTGWAAWNGIYALMQGGLDSASGLRIDGARYHAARDDWTVSADFVTGTQHEWGAAAWTGQELVVWSGLDNGLLVDDGERGQP